MSIHPEPDAQAGARFARRDFDFATVRMQRLPERFFTGERLLREVQPQAAQLEQSPVLVPRVAFADVQQQIAVLFSAQAMTLMSPLPNGIEPKAFVLGVDQTTFRQSCAGVAGVESAAVACPWQRNSRVTPVIERVSVIILAILS